MVIEDKSIEIAGNRLVLFDGDLLHTGSSPTKHKNRILINSNYAKKEYVAPRVELRMASFIKELEDQEKELGKQEKLGTNNALYS